MIKKLFWLILIAGIIFLPFLTAQVHKIATYVLYILFSLALFYFAIKEKIYLKDKIILLPLLVWLLIILFTSLYAVNQDAAFENMGNMFFLILAFVVLAGFEIKRKKQLAVALLTGSFLIALIAIWQHFFFFDRIMPSLVYQDYFLTDKEFSYMTNVIQGRRATSVFVSPNLLASYLVMANITAFSFYTGKKKKLGKIVLLILLIINFYALWLTRSLAGLFSFVVGVFIFSVFFSMKNKKNAFSSRNILIYLGIGLLILFIVLFLRRLFYESGANNLLLSLEGRLEFWRASLRIIAARPWQFAGLGGLPYFYYYFSPQAKIESIMAHNLFLQLWVETGIYGLLVFVWFLVTLIFQGLKGLFTKGLSYEFYFFKAAALAGILAFLFHNLFDFSFFITQPAIIWWLLCSFLVNNGQPENNFF